MGKPTPGPWEVFEIEDDVEGLLSRGVRQKHGRGLNTGEQYEMFSTADAHLIAAAPDLLDALGLSVAALEDLGACDDPKCQAPYCLRALQKARAALALARGGK